MKPQEFRLLVVDDNEDNRYTLTRRLTREGYTHIATARDGAEALGRLGEEDFDVLLLDIMMPKMDGYQVLEHMKGDGRLRNVPVIMISAIDDIDSVVRCIELGAEDYLTKPFNPVLLRARVGATLEKKRLRELEKVFLTHHDALTGLPNRAQFLNRLGASFDWHKSSGRNFALLVIEHDTQRMITETFGGRAAADTLAEQARQIAAAVGQLDFLARLDGREFGLIIDEVDDVADAVDVAERIASVLSEPIRVRGHTVYPGISIGIATTETDYQNPDDMLRDAYLAMHRARSRGDRCALFNEAMHSQAVRRLKLEADLRTALDRKELLLVYQPIICLNKGIIRGFEALMRWNHPEEGVISPLEFIPLAEESGLIVPMGAWALREALSQGAAWQNGPANGHARDLFMSVNVSRRQFLASDLISDVDMAFNESGFQGSLSLEFTESLVMEDPPTANRILQDLRARGVKASIDDFGTGYSSLSHLHQLTFDTLKIDRAFVSRMADNPTHRDIVQTIATLAHRLDMDIVAEGVETVEDMRLLKAQECENGQGYYFARPLEGLDAGRLLASGCRWENGEPAH